VTPTKTAVKILLVEDNEISADMLSRRLVRRGFAVVRATDGLEAVVLARQERPDVILMDLSLPEIDGWEATRRIKRDPATAAIPVLALTAHAMATDRETSLNAGCDDFDTKPVDMARLLAKLAVLLRARVTED
jgi:two-component system cell cycle response regulator DivK